MCMCRARRPFVLLLSGIAYFSIASPALLVGQESTPARQRNDQITRYLERDLKATVQRDLDRADRPIVEIKFAEVVTLGMGRPTLDHPGRLKESAFVLVSQLTDLRSLTFDKSIFSNEDLVHLETLPNLTHLSFVATGFNATGMQHVCNIGSLESLDLSYIRPLPAESLKLLADLPCLKRLGLNASSNGGGQNEQNWLSSLSITIHRGQDYSDHNGSCRGGLKDEDISFLEGLSLESLSLVRTRIRNEGIKKLIEWQPGLKELDLSYVQLRDDGARHLGRLKQLRVLKLKMVPITMETAESWSGLKCLETLDLYGSPVTDVGVAHLSGLPNLRELDLSCSAITRPSIKTLLSLPALEKLKLEKTRIVFEDLQRLADANDQFDLKKLLIGRGRASADAQGRLISANLKYMGLQDEDLGFLEDHPKLQYLDLGKNQITNQGLAHVASLVELRKLVLDGNRIDDEGIAQLKSLDQLGGISVDGTEVTLSALGNLFVTIQGRIPREALAAAGVFGSDRINLTRFGASDDDMQMVAGVEGIRVLKLVGNQITNRGMKHFLSHAELETLWIEEANLTGEVTRSLSSISGLKQLWCPNVPIANEDLESLQELRHLQVLNLCGCPIDDGAVQFLKGITSLKTVIFDLHSLSDDGIADLKTGLPGVEVIRSQRNALAVMRNRSRVKPRIVQGSTRRVQFAGIATTIDEHPLIEMFGDEFFEVADKIHFDSSKMMYIAVLDQKRLSDLASKSLPDLATIQRVSFMGVELPDGTFEVLNRMPNLTKMRFYRTQLGNNQLKDLDHLGQLEELGLQRSSVTAQQLNQLGDMPSLKRLSLGGSGTEIDNLDFLGKMRNLESLDVSRTQTDDEDAESISKLIHLRHFSARETGITDAGLHALSHLRALERIDFGSTKVTDKGLEALRELPKLKRVWLDKKHITGDIKYPFKVSDPFDVSGR